MVSQIAEESHQFQIKFSTKMIINRIKTANDNSSEINKQVLEKKSADVIIYCATKYYQTVHRTAETTVTDSL